MFNKPWSEVTDEDMNQLADKYEQELGGWIFHQPVDWNNKTPWVNRMWDHPEVMKNWMENKPR